MVPPPHELKRDFLLRLVVRGEAHDTRGRLVGGEARPHLVAAVEVEPREDGGAAQRRGDVHGAAAEFVVRVCQGLSAGRVRERPKGRGVGEGEAQGEGCGEGEAQGRGGGEVGR